MISIREILPYEYSPFQPMVFQQYRELFNKESTIPVLVVGAWVNAMPCGVVLFQLPKKQEHTVLCLSIFVNPLFRKQGIGLSLLEKGTALLEKKGYKKVEGQYQQEYKMKDALERLLDKAGWEYAPHRLLAYSTYVRFLEDPLLQRIARLPNGFSYFLWKDLQPKDAEEIQVYFKESSVNPMFNPLLPSSNNFLHQCSVGLRYQEEVIGWMIVMPHHLPRQIFFATMYVKPEYAKRGFGLALVYESSRLEREHLGESYDSNIDGGLWQVMYDNPNMVHITENKLGKHCHQIVHYHLAKKKLGEKVDTEG